MKKIPSLYPHGGLPHQGPAVIRSCPHWEELPQLLKGAPHPIPINKYVLCNYCAPNPMPPLLQPCHPLLPFCAQQSLELLRSFSYQGVRSLSQLLVATAAPHPPSLVAPTLACSVPLACSVAVKIQAAISCGGVLFSLPFYK